jgi:uncharacterized protein with von Willebrand factor type A (vWA) domain
MYPFNALPENLAAFCRLLRRSHGFNIGPEHLLDAARALEVVELSDEHAVRHALRPILTSTADELTIFDRVFTEFFFPGRAGSPQLEQVLPASSEAPGIADDSDAAERRGSRESSTDTTEDSKEGARPDIPSETSQDQSGDSMRVLRATYSPLAINAAVEPELTPVERAWQDAARSLVRRLHLGLSRRWRPARRGRRFDLRRTLRASLQTGGEPLAARWLRRPHRTPRFVVLVDGSRSMSLYTEAALDLAVALTGATARVEVFAFSTSLQRLTRDVRRACAGGRGRVPGLRTAWGGGTSIGVCLRGFVRRYGGRLLDSDTLVVIVSDGLDVGDIDILRGAMREIHRRSAGVVWLNPLAATPGYEPTARGMRTARPYITTLASVRHAADLAALARNVRLRF